MKREGRQHGMVRTYWILPSPLKPRPTARFVNHLDYLQQPDCSPKSHPSQPTTPSSPESVARLAAPAVIGTPLARPRTRPKGPKRSDRAMSFQIIGWSLGLAGRV
ncbi:hypothetical protein FEM48_Zijuj04G0016200 [Ziziphus jujuba var. spinosa]|uniref:Uncharacterized protein n=1 Tax=Ziziphus jujuba var. spinosa TaxID=714518 RepID=A0A978VH37_ZIZJJ|nr:hypothetical protein FEM48_Zijuj04G0016200 [Ziziphus jujuba var. spinosa]